MGKISLEFHHLADQETCVCGVRYWAADNETAHPRHYPTEWEDFLSISRPGVFQDPDASRSLWGFLPCFKGLNLKGAAACCVGASCGECQQLGVVPSVPGDAAARPVLRRPAAPRRAVHLLRRADAGRRADEHGDVGDVCRAAGDRGRLAAHPGTVRRHPAQRGELRQRAPIPQSKALANWSPTD